MEILTTAEILELILLSNELVQAQFLYWMIITTVVIVAGFTVIESLTRNLRFAITAVYVAITLVFVVRWVSMGTNLVSLLLEASERGVVWGSSLTLNIQANLILAIYVSGAALTIWAVNSKSYVQNQSGLY